MADTKALERRLAALEKQLAEMGQRLGAAESVVQQLLAAGIGRPAELPPRPAARSGIATQQALAIAQAAEKDRTHRKASADRERRRVAAQNSLGGRASAQSLAEERIRQMAAQGDPVPVKADLLSALIARIPGLSLRAATRAWENAAPLEWRRAGPKGAARTR